MHYVEEQIMKYDIRRDNLDKILNGLWAEKISCTVRNRLMFDGIQGACIMHYDVIDIFHEILLIMKENDLTLEDLTFELNLPELPCPDLIFSICTKEHKYEYYPVLLSSTYNSEGDEYLHIKSRIGHLRAVYCDSKPKPEEND
jgi:hypothetical protein